MKRYKKYFKEASIADQIMNYLDSNKNIENSIRNRLLVIQRKNKKRILLDDREIDFLENLGFNTYKF